MAHTPIRRIYLISHTHTDLGFTDHADVLRLHHRDILDRALDACEETFDAPEGTQHRWTCEVTATTLDYLRHTTPANVDRFVALHRAGRIAVAALRHHWTPLATKPLAARTLTDIDHLRDDFGINVRSAMQCDVNGLAWFWNELLLARGVDFLSMHQNPHRGYWGEHLPSVWHWQNRSGGQMLVHQGEHYGVGGFLRLSRPGEADRDGLMDIIERHTASEHWPADFSVINVTNAANGDNAFPDPWLTTAVQQWNEREAILMEIITIDRLGEIMRDLTDLPVQRGEWMDSWGDGVASTPLETAAARTAERLLPTIERLGRADPRLVDELVDTLALYDEHTWGAHSAATAPDNLFATMQRTAKSNHAYRALALAMRLVATGSRQHARPLADTVEGDHRFDQYSHATLGADEHAYWVANPSDVSLSVDWPVPFDRGAGPQISIPQAYGADAFFPGFGDDGWTDAMQDKRPSGEYRLQAELPPRTVTVVRPVKADAYDCAAGPDWIENGAYRVTLCARTGGLRSWLDKATGAELLAEGVPIMGPQVQVMRAGFGRRDIFLAPYWERRETPMGWNQADLFEDDTATVTIDAGAVGPAGAAIRARIAFATGVVVETLFTLAPGQHAVHVTARQRAIGIERAFSINWPLAFADAPTRLWIDTGDGLVDALADHLPVSSTRWQCAHRGIAFEHPGGAMTTVAAPDTPLFQPGGPWTKEPFTPPRSAVHGCFWAVNTHWDTNFAVRVDDVAIARYTLGHLPSGGRDAAMAQLERHTTLPVIVRAPDAAPRPVKGGEFTM